MPERDTNHSDSHESAPAAHTTGPEFEHTLSEATLARWFGALQALQRRATRNDDFFTEAVRLVVEPGGLDFGLMLVRHGDEWRIDRQFGDTALPNDALDLTLVQRACRNQEPIVCQAQHGDCLSRIAAPIFDADSSVRAVLFGGRRQNATNRRRTIRRLEALWVQLVAEALTSGVVRQDREDNERRQRHLLDNALPREIAQQWAPLNADEIPGERREVTILFADLVDSSKLCQRLPTGQADRLLSETLDMMTAAAKQTGGVIVDTYGDGMIAMWNAPQSQVDHAERACRAGLRIVAQQSDLNAIWRHETGCPIRMAVGVHTGPTIVGNSGSRHRIKYGPRGMAVYLANRIERASRVLRQAMLISESTRRQLPAEMDAFRLGKFKLWGIEQPAVLYALAGDNESEKINACCSRKHERLSQLIADGQLLQAANELDHCCNCDRDELSFGFIREQLMQLTLADKNVPAADDDAQPVYDLTAKDVSV